jgi:hypothetical protein
MFGHTVLTPPNDVNPLYVSQLKQMLGLFKAHGLKVIPSFIDFYFLAEDYPNWDGKGHAWGGGTGRYDAVNVPEKRAKLLSLLQALLKACAGFEQQIYAWEVINEPSWNTRAFAPPTRPPPPNDSKVFPHPITVRSSVMSEFIGEACKRIEDAGFASTVGHRFYCDLTDFPTGTKPQFHYYAEVYPTADRDDIPSASDAAKAVGGKEVFVGEISPGTKGQPWPKLKGRDAGDTKRRVFERLKHLASNGYKLALLWPDRGWEELDPTKGPLPGKSNVMTWEEFKANPIDPLSLSTMAQEGVVAFNRSLFRNGIPDPEE